MQGVTWSLPWVLSSPVETQMCFKVKTKAESKVLNWILPLGAVVSQLSHQDFSLDCFSQYYYSVKDISVGGMCICYGHARACPPDPVTSVCMFIGCLGMMKLPAVNCVRRGLARGPSDGCGALQRRGNRKPRQGKTGQLAWWTLKSAITVSETRLVLFFPEKTPNCFFYSETSLAMTVCCMIWL